MTSSLFSIMAQSNTGSDWNWLLTFIIFVVVLAVALIIQAFFSKHDAAELEFHEHEEEAHHEEGAHHEAVAQPEHETQAEAEPEPQAEVELETEPESQPETPAEPDTLEKLEGIGPKVASLLNDNGITTFAQLADTTVEKLQDILDSNKLQMIHPVSWHEQAKLAAAGDWDALQKLQDELKGGR
jgi:predicted flap endonuclease-1-like 5' DNA nuclease